MKKIKFIIFIPIIIIIAIWATYICFDRDVESLNTLDLDTVKINKEYTLVKFSEIQSCLYKNLSQKQIDKIRDSEDYPQDKLEGQQGTTLDGVGICVVDGKITQYAVSKQNIIVYDRDSGQYYGIRKSDNQKRIIYKNTKNRIIDKIQDMR